uniref:Decapping nuclease n=1 Tax=Cyprinus carpio TaxID=7962 RepID=A0A8C1UH91_CYPCA
DECELSSKRLQRQLDHFLPEDPRRRSSDERQHRAGLTDSCMWSWAASHRNDQRQLRYYVQDGYTSRFVKRDNRVKEKLDHVLKWILANRDRFTKKIWVLETNVTWRGHLTIVLTTPYETQEGWMLAFRGTIYISEVETEAARVHRETRSERQEEMMCWGYKSEQYLCADAVDGTSDPGGIVNTNEAFCTVVQTRLADHKLLFSGEVDCRVKDPDAPAAPGCYVELKTSAEICTLKQRSNFHRYKLLKWWAHSFLPGVQQIVAGFRDYDGIVVSVETFRTENFTTHQACMYFCDEFLSFVKSVIKEEDPRLVYLFTWDPHRDVTFTVHRDSQSPKVFLPEWYIKDTRSH